MGDIMTSAEILTQHKERIFHFYGETKSWQKVFERLSTELPNGIGMQAATFKQYAPIMLELNNELNKEMFSRIESHAIELDEFELSIYELNNQLNKAKQDLIASQELNNQLNNQLALNIELNNPALNSPVKQLKVKHGLNIAGWTVASSRGYFRAFKKVAGKQIGVYLGKTLDNAAEKIEAKEQRINSGRHTDTSIGT